MHTSKLHHALAQLLQSSAWLEKRHTITLVEMVLGLIMSAKFNLSERVPFVAGRAHFAQSRERLMKRWLYNERIEAMALYTPLMIQSALQDSGVNGNCMWRSIPPCCGKATA